MESSNLCLNNVSHKLYWLLFDHWTLTYRTERRLKEQRLNVLQFTEFQCLSAIMFSDLYKIKQSAEA